MQTKAEQTKAYILEKVAPVFNTKGYIATSLSDLTSATGLTKGALYCHYENKEDLAVHAYKLMIKKVLKPLTEQMEAEESAAAKLLKLTNYYRDYQQRAKLYGGCPILNIGMDAHHNNQALYELARNVSQRLESDLKDILDDAVTEEFLREDTDTSAVAGKVFSMIEGGVFMSTLHHRGSYLRRMMEEVEGLIARHQQN